MMNQKDNTNWKFWYWTLVVVLLVQIVIYLLITKWYEA